MFNNIGGKIKSLGTAIAVLGITGSVFAGFILIIEGSESYYGGGALIGLGIGVLIGGSLLSWISSWFMYGFGELIVKATEIARNTATEAPAGPLTAKMESDKKLEALIEWKEKNLISEEEFELKKQELQKGE